MNQTISSRDRMLAALNCETLDHPPCSFMLFGALHQSSASYLEFIKHQLNLGLDAFVELPPRPPTSGMTITTCTACRCPTIRRFGREQVSPPR